VPSILGNGRHKWRVSASVILFVYIVFAGAVTGSGQDLGALARQEQARKEAQGIHPVHVYTNDDLLRPRILVPEDSVDLETARRKLPLALAQQPPAPESDAQGVSLGEVARKYHEQKVALQRQSSEAAHFADPSYVYTNDDMTRPTILMPEDRLKYQAGLERPVPTTTMAPAELSAENSAVPETSLGDMARVAFQQQEHILAAPVPMRHSFKWLRTVTASRINPPPQSPPKYTPVVALPRKPRSERRSEGSGYTGREAVTVRSGDSLWKLARQHLGRGYRWRALLKANPWIRDPNHLNVGSQIRI